MFNRRLRFTPLTTLTVILMLLFAAPVAAQPASITPLASAPGALTDRDREAIVSYARYWTAQLSASNGEAVSLARRRLLEPLRSPGIRLIFRDEYSRAAVPELERIVNEANGSIPLVNALQIMGSFGTEQAMRTLVDRADPDTEPRMAARLWAANGFRLAVDQNVIGRDRLTPYIRDLSRAAERETHWMVLLREFEALSTVSNELARESQINVLTAALDRVESDHDESAQLMHAVRRALVLFREQYLQLNPTEQRTMGAMLAPQLGRVLALGQSQWEQAMADSAIKTVYHGAIQLAETQLRIIDQQLRSNGDTPRTTLDSAWSRTDQAAYSSDVAKWSTILDRPPYVDR